MVVKRVRHRLRGSELNEGIKLVVSLDCWADWDPEVVAYSWLVVVDCMRVCHRLRIHAWLSVWVWCLWVPWAWILIWLVPWLDWLVWLGTYGHSSMLTYAVTSS